MTEPSRLDALVDRGEAGELLLRAPALGIYADAPRVGEVLVAGSFAGRLSVLGRGVDVVLPEGAAGRVVECRLKHHRDPVEHGQALLRLVPVDAAGIGEPVGAAGTAASVGLPDGAHAITSPTHGVFYSRSRPDAPAYVTPGQVIEAGATVGLLEVMKCFTAIPYGGPGLPARAEVVEVRAKDGAEVGVGELLVVVRPVRA